MNTAPERTEKGLTAAEVAERIAAGQTNDVPERTSRSVWDIARANVFTRINAILGVLLLVVLATGSALDALFGFIIIVNSSIGIVQGDGTNSTTLDELLARADELMYREKKPGRRRG